MALRGIGFEDEVWIQEIQGPVPNLCKHDNDDPSVCINAGDWLISRVSIKRVVIPWS
jgi:hypothetical protein